MGQEINEELEKVYLAFFDAETNEEKIELVKKLGNDITDRMINNMAASMDLVIADGPLAGRRDELLQCLSMRQKYEKKRA